MVGYASVSETLVLDYFRRFEGARSDAREERLDPSDNRHDDRYGLVHGRPPSVIAISSGWGDHITPPSGRYLAAQLPTFRAAR